MNLLLMISEQVLGSSAPLLNAGHVRRLRLLRKQDVLGVIDPVRHVGLGGSYEIPAAGLMAALDATVYLPQVQPRTIRFSETPTDSEQGLAYEQSLSMDVPNPSPELLAWLLTHNRTEWLLVWEDYNDTAWLSGTEENGLRMLWSRSVASQNALVITWTGRLPLPSFVVAGFEPAELFPDSAFDYSFNFDFAS